MIIKKEIIERKKVISSFSCDICGTLSKTEEELGTFQKIEVIGTYFSKYIPDGLSLSIRICESCFCQKILKEMKSCELNPSFSYTEDELKKIGFEKMKEDILSKC